jgi:hypothetical protein
MNEALIAALKERLSLEVSEVEIINELLGAGYPADIAKQALAEAKGGEQKPLPSASPISASPQQSESNRWEEPSELPFIIPEAEVAEPSVSTQAPPPPPPPPPVSTPASSPGAATPPLPPTMAAPQPEAPSSHITPGGKWPVVIGAAVIGLALIGGGTYAAMNGGFSALFGSIGSSAPYADEAEMIAGLVTNTQSLTAHGINIDMQFAIEERGDDAVVFDTTVLPKEEREEFNEGVAAAFQMGMIPAEVDMQVQVAGVVDGRVDPNLPEFDLSLSFNMLAEPFILQAAGSIRMADGVFYGKLDDFPANFKSQLPKNMPMGAWIELADTQDLSLPVEPYLPLPAIEAMERIPEPVKQLVWGELQRIAALPAEVYEQSRGFMSSQAAQIGAPLLNSDVNKETAELQKRTYELLRTYPLFVFIGTPKRVQWNDETVYEYQVDLDVDNLKSYAFAAIAEAESIYDETLPIEDRELNEIFAVARPILEEFNRLTDLRYYFRGDGSTAGASFSSIFTFDNEEIDRQFRTAFTTFLTRQDDAMDITAPEDLYPETLEEIIEAHIDEMYGSYDSYYAPPSASLSKSDQDMLIEQALGSVRLEAEIYFNQNNFSYRDLCEDLTVLAPISRLEFQLDDDYVNAVASDVQDSSGPAKIVCNDGNTGYAFIMPLSSDMNRSWCVDSTGYLDEADPYALESGTDVSCR